MSRLGEISHAFTGDRDWLATVVRRAVLTFVQTALALFILSLDGISDGVVDMSVVLKIGTAALAAGLSVVTSAIREINDIREEHAMSNDPEVTPAASSSDPDAPDEPGEPEEPNEDDESD